MSLSYREYYHGKTGLTVGVERQLFSEQTPYQHVEVYQTDTWGNLLTIDGMVMLSEKDEFVYHEMLVHPSLFTHPDPRRVLIVGGGDGGSAREVLRHRSVERVDLVEIDETVVRASKEFLPEVGPWEDPKLRVIHEDGVAFVRDIGEPYDVILVDGSDPAGPAEGLFEKDFMKACYEALAQDGVLAAQAESPWVEAYHPSMRKIFGALDELFPHCRMYLAWIPLYPTGMWSFVHASKGADPLSGAVTGRVAKGLEEFGDALKYYNPDIHTGAFALPNFVRDIVDI